MAINVSQPEGNKIMCPQGTFQAVCSGVWDLGNQKATWNGVSVPKRMVYIRWEIDETIPDEGEYQDKRYVCGKRYTAILTSKSNLLKDLTAWRGKGFTKDELEGFDLECLIGANCLLTIEHREGQERIYANVISISPLTKNMQKMTPELPNVAPDWVTKAQQNQFSVSDEPEDYQPRYEDINPHGGQVQSKSEEPPGFMDGIAQHPTEM